jgi:3-methylcrotonyl-CoA carboxylase alpha subunit
MFDRILIANRGEIACRVIRTARRLGVATVAVYSDADAASLHVEMADVAVRIGPPPAAQSYLDGARIIEAALATRAQAIHPGYGFLSENPDFVDLATGAGLVFIGPPAKAIRAMGLKDAAKALMAAAGVPVVPGYHGENQDDAFLGERAAEIGYPVLIKAVAGGGGKGMRKVDAPRDFRAALVSARAEAASAFGNPSVLVEKYVAAPRHIEIQVFGDNHGRAVHLFERDCSLQRRHQKVIEEAPAPGMTPAMRAAMGAAAVEAAQAIGYSGAGTVEFIVDGANLSPDGFWFMEMNTRLQVEHPVTEAITGVDLVEWQLRVASGEPLPMAQDALAIDGHAFEARLYAEDPARGFLPAIGTLTDLDFPSSVRADSGVRAGDAISPHYDPMIAKLVVHGPDRATALRRLRSALDETTAAGSVTNLAFLGRLTRDPDFAAARLDTDLIARNLEALTETPPPGPLVRAAAILATQGLIEDAGPLTGFSLWTPLLRSVALCIGSETTEHLLAVEGPRRFFLDGETIEIAGWDGRLLTLRRGGVTHRLRLAIAGPAVTVFDGAESYRAHVPDPLTIAAEQDGGDDVRAPMPGLVRRLTAAAGQFVAKNDVLVVLEAMKMEHALVAPRDGVLAAVHVTEGAQVTEGALLLALAPVDG